MNHVTLLWILAGVALVAAILKMRFSNREATFRTSPASQVTLEEVKRLVQEGQTIKAIQGYRLLHPVSLKSAKNAVDLLIAGQALPEEGSEAPSGGFAEVRRLAEQGRKIEAIKRYRELTSVGLGDAKYAVESGNYIHPAALKTGDEPTMEAIREVARTGDLIRAIKMYRKVHPSAGLAEAKALVERMQAGE